MYVAVDPDADMARTAYVLELVSDIAGLETPLRPVVADTGAFPDGVVLAYGVRPQDSAIPFIPRRDRLTAGDMVLRDVDLGGGRKEHVLVWTATTAEEPGTAFGFDVLFNIFAYASCLEEFEHEQVHGPIHSYALRLTTDHRRFDRPYAHMLIKALATLLPGRKTTPAPAICLTHDVDAVSKALPNRLKEGAFRLANSVAAALRGRPAKAGQALEAGLRMLTSVEDYFGIPALAEMEKSHGFVSTFNVYSGLRPRGAKNRALSALFDPAYDPAASSGARLRETLRRLDAEGFETGVHFSFGTFEDASAMTREKHRLEQALGLGALVSSRQHWLRFSLLRTWKSLWEAGIRVDSTLGFNDRAGFRAGLAAPFHPYDHETAKALPILAVPTFLMDTHLFYYKSLCASERDCLADSLVEEVRALSGQACVIWHTHVFSADHCWGREYQVVLEAMRRRGVSSSRLSRFLDNRAAQVR